MASLPRVLVISQDIPCSVGAGPIVLYRLLQRWPSDRLLVAGPPVPMGAERLPCVYRTFRPPGWRLEVSRLAKLSRLLTLSRLRAALGPSMKQLAQFQPDLVLMVMQNLSFSELAYQFSQARNVPMVIVVHDDPEDFERNYPWADSMIVERNARIYRHAVSRLCVSPEMRDLLEHRYGVTGEVLYPIRSESLIPRAAEESLVLKNPDFLTLGYAGGLNYGYEARLEELIPVFRQSGVRLRIYSKQSPRCSAPGVVSYAGGFSTPEMVWDRVKLECDAVILPYCYRAHGHQRLYRTHFPSKLPEYLGLGMPVIIGGPEYATGVKWGLRNPDACLVITEQQGAAWLSGLARLRTDSELRLRLSNGAVAAGRRDFDPAAIRSAFISALCAAPMSTKVDRLET